MDFKQRASGLYVPDKRLCFMRNDQGAGAGTRAGTGGHVRKAAAAAAAYDPDSETSILVNMGFAEGDITKDGSDIVEFIAGNLGTADFALNDYYNSDTFTWVADCRSTGKPGINCATGANIALGARNEANSADATLTDIVSTTTKWITIVAYIDAATTAAGNLFGTSGAWCDMNSDGNNGVTARNYDGNYDETAAETAGEGAVHVYTLKQTGGSIYMGVDGTFGTGVTTGTTGADPKVFIAETFIGSILRIMGHSSVPSNETEILDGLKTFYGVS